MGVNTGPQLALYCEQIDGPHDEAVVLVWPTHVEIHRSTSAGADVKRWVEAWIAGRPGWEITRVEVDPAGLVEVLTLRPTL